MINAINSIDKHSLRECECEEVFFFCPITGISVVIPLEDNDRFRCRFHCLSDVLKVSLIR